MFKVPSEAKLLDSEKAGIFHTFLMRAMSVTKRGQPNINPGISFLFTRTQNPNESDWKKLLKLLWFIEGTIDNILTLEADDSQTLTWYVDAVFAVVPDVRSHTGAMFIMSKGTIYSTSTKQQVNSRSSTKAELIAVNDTISKIIWTKKFVESQGLKVKLNVLYQYNESTLKLAKNGKESSGKRTCHFDIKYFYITNLISRDEVSIEYCPANVMTGDYMPKPLVGGKFSKVQKRGTKPLELHQSVQQECVGHQIFVRRNFSRKS
eukprot:1210175-Ditylum_brightwellii.AAC.1